MIRFNRQTAGFTTVFVLFCVIGIHGSSALAQGANLVVNGSFEAPGQRPFRDGDLTTGWRIRASNQVPGWTVEWMPTVPPDFDGRTRPDVAFLEFHRGLLGWQSADGHQHVELDTDWDGGIVLTGEPASVLIYQDIRTCPGESYTLTFASTPRPNFHGDGEDRLRVRWDGIEVTSVSGVRGVGVNWR